MPLPQAVEDLVGTRVAQLDGPVRRLVLALALDTDLRVSRIDAIADQTVLEDALDAGVVALDGDRLRPAHPLLAAAAKSGSRARDRRALHVKLADVSSDDELRALHLAMAAQLPEEALADTVAAAAAGASARGSAQQAVVLAEHALRLTPADATNRSERVLDLAGYLEVAGERQRVTDLLEPELDSFSPFLAPPGSSRRERYIGATSRPTTHASARSTATFRAADRSTLFSGTHDILHSDAKRFALRAFAREAGVSIDYHEAPDMLHVYPLFPTRRPSGASNHRRSTHDLTTFLSVGR